MGTETPLPSYDGSQKKKKQYPEINGEAWEWVNTERGVKEEVWDHFEQVFTTQGTDEDEGPQGCISRHITVEMRDDLDLKDDEIR